jgi:hypothetical protein
MVIALPTFIVRISNLAERIQTLQKVNTWFGNKQIILLYVFLMVLVVQQESSLSKAKANQRLT